MVNVILVEPQSAGNIGSIARAMKNFGAKQLYLINPAANHKSITAKKFAMHGADILAKAKKISWQEALKHDIVIATTAKIGSDYNIPRSPLTPKQAAAKLAGVKNRKVALVLGREDRGLLSSEIRDCDYLVTIPTAKYAALNIAQAATILLYELHNTKSKEFFTPISAKEKKVLLELINKDIASLQFSTKEKRETQRRVWKRVIGKSLLTKREAFALLGFFRKRRI